MTKEQAALIRYWLIGLGMVVGLLFLYLIIGDPERFRWWLLPIAPLALYFERRFRPDRPASAPTPLEFAQTSRALSLMFVLYALCAVGIAIASISSHDLGSWLSHRPWLLGPMILVPVLVPLIGSEINFYRVLGDERDD